MQVQKAYIRQRLLQQARLLFMDKGYRDTSMREISDAARVGLSNCYHYFPSKDSLFRTIVQPAVDAMDAFQQLHHGEGGYDAMQMRDPAFIERTTAEYMSVITRHRPELFLLFFRAAGSSLESFRQDYVDRTTALVQKWFRTMKRKHPALRDDAPEFFIRLNNVWLCALLEEVIRQDLDDELLRAVLEKYVRFKISGWRNLLQF